MLVALFLPGNCAGDFTVLFPSPRGLLPRSLGLCPGRAVRVRVAQFLPGNRVRGFIVLLPSPASGRGGETRALALDRLGAIAIALACDLCL